MVGQLFMNVISGSAGFNLDRSPNESLYTVNVPIMIMLAEGSEQVSRLNSNHFLGFRIC